jgi:hypothetical protein
MAINFDNLLTADEQAAIKTARLKQFAEEAIQHQLNKQVAEALGDTASVEQADKALEVLEAAINVYSA